MGNKVSGSPTTLRWHDDSPCCCGTLRYFSQKIHLGTKGSTMNDPTGSLSILDKPHAVKVLHRCQECGHDMFRTYEFTSNGASARNGYYEGFDRTKESTRAVEYAIIESRFNDMTNYNGTSRLKIRIFYNMIA